MADDKAEAREASWRNLLPWTELFRCFSVALDLNKLILAAMGIFVMAFGWWLLALVFAHGPDKPPIWPSNFVTQAGGDEAKGWEDFKRARDRWNLLHEAAGIGGDDQRWEAADLARTRDEYEAYGKAVEQSKAPSKETLAAVDKAITAGNTAEAKRLLQDATDPIGKLTRSAEPGQSPLLDENRARVWRARLDPPARKLGGRLNTWPWFEPRGQNPYLLATGGYGVPWEAGHFWDWFSTQQVPVLIEPLVKMILPVRYLLSPSADFGMRIYFFFVLLWTLATWSVFGGAITRMAVVQVARGEKTGVTEALRFTTRRILSYVCSPLFPLIIAFGLIVFMVIYGYFYMIPVFGDIAVAGLFWWVMIVFGLILAVIFVGLVGWPLMMATISAEGTDAWEAVSRSYQYVWQRPWHYIWYALVSVSYGAVVVFFIGFMGSFMVYLAKWGVDRTPFLGAREPSFLFAYAPTSFHWRDLLLRGAQVDGQPIVDPVTGEIIPEQYDKFVGRNADFNLKDPDKKERLTTYNQIGAAMVAFWLGIVFLLLLGFGYSFFWSASSIIYLLMRREVDGAEMDEVYPEDEDQEGPYRGPLVPPASTGTPPGAVQVATPVTPGRPGAALTMVEPPAMRPPAAAPTPASTPEEKPEAGSPETPAKTGDGESPKV
jgi:hypothetical protein